MRAWKMPLLMALILALIAGCGGEDETSPQEESGGQVSADVPGTGDDCRVTLDPEVEPIGETVDYEGSVVEVVTVRGPLECSEAEAVLNADHTSAESRAEGIDDWLCRGAPPRLAPRAGDCSNQIDDRKFKISLVEGNPEATQSDGGAQRLVEVEITAEGFNPASAKVTTVGRIIFNNTDSEPHTVVAPAGDEHVVEAGATFNFKNEGCCGATFTDKETGTEFEITVPREATGLYD